MPETLKEAADFIKPLYINGLEGRMLRAPASGARKREILLVYGHHAMLERWWSLVENLRPYGNVTMPDLPGFGGMQSFAKIGIKPEIDAYADYLAAFIKLRYKRQRITIIGISFGFVVVTRMLQRYPEIAARTDLLVSIAGFMRSDDFLWSKNTSRFYRFLARLFATRPVAFLIRYTALNNFVIRWLTKTMPKSKHRLIETAPTEMNDIIKFEVQLWRANDVRTHWLTTNEFFHFDNTAQHVGLAVEHVTSKGEHYLNNLKVEEHMRRVFKKYRRHESISGAHVPHTTADIKTAGVLLPAGLRRLLSKKS